MSCDWFKGEGCLLLNVKRRVIGSGDGSCLLNWSYLGMISGNRIMIPHFVSFPLADKRDKLKCNFATKKPTS